MEKSEQFLPEISSRDSFDVLKKFFLSPPNQLTLSERVKAQLILREMGVDQFFSLYDQFGKHSEEGLIFKEIYSKKSHAIDPNKITEKQKRQLFLIIGSSLQEDTGKEVPKTSEQEETGKERQTTLETQTSSSEIHTGTKAEENVNLPDSQGPEQPKNPEDSNSTEFSAALNKKALTTPKKEVIEAEDDEVYNISEIEDDDVDDISAEIEDDDVDDISEAEAVKDDNPLGLTDDRVLHEQIEKLNQQAEILHKNHLALRYQTIQNFPGKLPFSEILRFDEIVKEQTESLTDLMKRGREIIDGEKDKYLEAGIVPVQEFSRLDQKLSFLNFIKESVNLSR